MRSRGCGRRVGKRRGFLVEIAEEIIEGPVDLHVDIQRRVNFDGIHFHVNASAGEKDAAQDKATGKHGEEVYRGTPGGNESFNFPRSDESSGFVPN
jgi:hypothetical protein